MGIDPGAPLGEKLATFLGEFSLADRQGHLLPRPQRPQIPDAGEGVGAKKLDIIGIVLDPLHDPILIGVPTTREPAIFEHGFDFWPV